MDVTKPSYLEEATRIIAEHNVTITTDGTKYLGTPMGSETFMNESIKQKIAKWIEEIKQLSLIAQSEPQSAFAAFTHSIVSEWLFFLRTVPATDVHLAPLEEAIRFIFMPFISGRSTLIEGERSLLSLPTRLGGMGIIDPRKLKEEIRRSREVTQPLTKHIIKKDHTYNSEMRANQLQARKEVKAKKRKEKEEEADLVTQTLDAPQKQAMILSQEKGASYWFTVLPMTVMDLASTKGHSETDCALDMGGSRKDTYSMHVWKTV